MTAKATLKIMLCAFFAAILLHLPVFMSAQKSQNQNRTENRDFLDPNDSGHTAIQNHSYNDRLGAPQMDFGLQMGIPLELGEDISLPITLDNIRGSAAVRIYSASMGVTELEDVRIYTESQGNTQQTITFGRPDRSGPIAIIVQACTGAFRADCLSRVIIVTVDGSGKIQAIN